MIRLHLPLPTRHGMTAAPRPFHPLETRRAARDVARYLLHVLGGVFVVGILLAALRPPMGSPTYTLLYAAGLLTPFLGAVLHGRRSGGAVSALRGMFLPLRLGRGGLMIVLLPAFLTASYAVGERWGLPVMWERFPGSEAWLLAALGWSAVMWAEETGWRGTLLPLLQRLTSPWKASVGVAAAWYVWHLPLLFLLGMTAGHHLLFALQVAGLSFAMTWAWNRSKTVLVPVLIHGVGNATATTLLATVPAWTANELLLPQSVASMALGLSVLVLTRGRLGLTPEDAGRGPEPPRSPSLHTQSILALLDSLRPPARRSPGKATFPS